MLVICIMVRLCLFCGLENPQKRGARFFAEKGTLLITQRRFLSCNSSKGCPKGVPPLLVKGGAHVGRQDVGLCARNRGVPSRSVARWSPAWRRTRATTLREKMVSKSRWNRFRDAVVPPPTPARGTACLRVITSGFCAQIRGIPPGELPGAAAPAPAPAPRSAARRRQRTFVDRFLPEKTPKTRDFTLAKPGFACRKSVQSSVHLALVAATRHRTFSLLPPTSFSSKRPPGAHTRPLSGR